LCAAIRRGSIDHMALRLLAVDMPPLIRELIAKALVRNAHEGVFVDLPASGGDVEALAYAMKADAVVAPLVAGGWPAYFAKCARGAGPLIVGLGCDDGRGRISEMRTVQTRRTDMGLDGLTIDAVIERAASVADGTSEHRPQKE
jgi:hypothetical protein